MSNSVLYFTRADSALSRAVRVAIVAAMRETDPRILKALREAFCDPASNVPDFTRTALTGGPRPDEGLEQLLPRDLTAHGKRTALKRALCDALARGETPTREEAAGDVAMRLDAATYYHFRVTAERVRLFVKVWYEDDVREPIVRVISVKRDDQAWSS